MNQTHTRQSLQKIKTSFNSDNNRHLNFMLQQKTYSKTLKPVANYVKPFSFKNLDLATSLNSESPMNESFQDNKSCCCLDCGAVSRKAKHLQKKFIIFTTKMSVLRKQRLQRRFKNAVLCIKYLLEKWKKIRQQERAKRLFRFKTKVFENQSFFPGQQHHYPNHIIYSNPQIPYDDKVNQNQQVQSIQAQMIDQKHKQRQSVRLYLQQKLNNNKIESSGTLPTIAYSKYHNSHSSKFLQPMRILKTLEDEQKSPKKEYNLLNYNSSLINSPYLCQFSGQKAQEQCFSQAKSPRSVIKSISSETFFPYRQNIHKSRKMLVKKFKIID
ncbi:unnamed protein product (macronuclear) [Paramecium tetraurelia]|uniref:Uncharacterized protein n=1 Tax=Paramecium tetraurelia TaxID=5888 RepID=A0BPN6_PARTE|nr:uncharacterized protein GSPATT00005253001 [Paramecium tetraurelia]CAK60503.1 unnamed protein product [Paramecium tetraurelia]|eukprot:XP_001427901.1 hypothetical protein (macronuclear) [Paramecium tetraurelia strain d4-2]